MHPYHFWKHAQEARRAHMCGEHAHAGEGGFEGFRAGHGHGHGDWGGGNWGGGNLGVRRPLRFLAHKLDLRDDQVAELARILGELKTERAQAEVDDRRTISAFADAVAPETFDESRAKEGGDLRVKSAENLRDAVTRALQKIHALLDEEQRKQLAYLIRTGVLTL